MTGWRIGWAAGPRDLIRALDTLLSQSAGNACSVSQAAAAAALNGDQSFVAESVATYRARRDKTAAGLNAIPGLSCRVPEGAFYLYVNCAGLIGKHNARRQDARDRRRRRPLPARERRGRRRRRRGLWPLALLPPVDRDVARHPRRRRRPHRRRRRRPALTGAPKTMSRHREAPSAPQADSELLERLQGDRRSRCSATSCTATAASQGLRALSPAGAARRHRRHRQDPRRRQPRDPARLRVLPPRRRDGRGRRRRLANALVGGIMTF